MKAIRVIAVIFDTYLIRIKTNTFYTFAEKFQLFNFNDNELIPNWSNPDQVDTVLINSMQSGLNLDHAIRVIVKTAPLLSHPCLCLKCKLEFLLIKFCFTNALKLFDITQKAKY